MSAFLEARQAGKVGFLGFSAHSVEAALALKAQAIKTRGLATSPIFSSAA